MAKAIPGTGRGRPIPGVSARPIPRQPSRFPGGRPRQTLRDMSGRFAGPAGVHWTGLEALIENTQSRGEAVYESLVAVAHQIAPEMEAWAQQAAEWQDVTGDARRGLHAAVIEDPDHHRVRIYLAHSVDYGLHLETMQGGRFAIIMPTLIVWSNVLPGVVASHGAMMRGLKR